MKVMSPNRVEEWRPSLIQPVFHELVDRFAARGRVELFHEFADKLLSALRYQFGGHLEKKAAEKPNA